MIAPSVASARLVAPWAEWNTRFTDGRRVLETGTFALTAAASYILAAIFRASCSAAAIASMP